MQQAVLQPPIVTHSRSGAPYERRPEIRLAKPNYRHQKKQKELARKTRHAEKLKKRLERDDAAVPTGTDRQVSAPDSPANESKP